VGYPKLRGRIKEKIGTQTSFAKAMDMNPTSLSYKLSGRTEWTRGEIARACQVLGIPAEEIHAYFFSPES